MARVMRVSGLVLVGLLGARSPAQAAEPNRWLGDDLPLPMPVKTPQDMAFKSAAERQYLIFNLMAGGKLAFQRGDYATAIDKWETLLRMPGLDPQIQAAVVPFLNEAHAKAAPGEPRAEIRVEPAGETPPPPTGKPGTSSRTTAASGGTGHAAGAPHHSYVPGVSVSGSVVGGGQIGPGGAVVWLKRLDGPAPRIQPPTNQIVTQREKTFLPHVLAVPLGTSVQFRNDDRIYHNVFSIAKPNDFDAGIRASGSTYTRTFNMPGAVQLLCNIHSTMSAYVFVVDSPYYAKAQASGAFVIHGVPPGRYELAAWHEAASQITRRSIVVGPEGHHDLNVTVAGDKRPGPFVPDKYGHKRQPQLGY